MSKHAQSTNEIFTALAQYFLANNKHVNNTDNNDKKKFSCIIIIILFLGTLTYIDTVSRSSLFFPLHTFRTNVS